MTVTILKTKKKVEVPPLPKGKFGAIAADPAWKFKTWSDKGLDKSPDAHYSTLTLQQICDLPVANLAKDDCALFLWCTWPTIFQAREVIEAWGFKYSGLAWEWIKYNDESDKFSFGTGYGTRKNVEPCLLARKGKPKALSNSVRDIMFSPRREHSRKPDVTYERIERLYKGPYCELFARQKWPGWTHWGDQVGKF